MIYFVYDFKRLIANHLYRTRTAQQVRALVLRPEVAASIHSRRRPCSCIFRNWPQLNLYKYIFLIFEFTIPYLNIHCTRTCTHTHTYIGILKLLYIKYRLNTEDGGGPKAPKGFIWRKAYAKRTKKTPEKNKENLLDRVLNITSFKTQIRTMYYLFTQCILTNDRNVHYR